MTQPQPDAELTPAQIQDMAKRKADYERQMAERQARVARQEANDRPVREMLEIVGFPSSVRTQQDATSINAVPARQDRRGSGKTFNVSIANDASMLDVMRVTATQMFHTNVAIIDTVTSSLNKPDVGFIAKAIETARVELLGDVWFSTKMALDTKDKLEDRNDSQVSRGMPANYNAHIGGAIEKVIYDLDGTIADDKIRNAMERFSKEIRAATMSMDSTAAINVAVDIAHYLEIEDEEEEEEPEGPGPSGNNGGDINGDGDGDNSGDKPDGDKPSGDDTSQPPGNQPAGGDTPNPNNADSETGTEVPTNTLTSEAPPEVEKVSPEEMKKRLNRNLRAGVTRRDKKAQANTGRAGTVQSLGTGSFQNPNQLYYDEHNAVRVTVGSVQTPVSEPVKLALKTYADNHSLHDHELYKRGMPSRSTWKMNYGNMRVFEQPPKIKGHVSILIDISSSMGCWCLDCNAPAFGIEQSPENSRYGRRRASNAFLAWQVSAALGKLHPTAEVFAYSSPTHNIGGHMQTAIYPLPAGHQPAACGNASEHICCGGTPTCSAMLWFKEHLSQRASSTTAIIITDGHPNGCGPSESPHVEFIGADMIGAGLKFGTVFIGNGKYLNLPTEVSVNVASTADLRNIQPILTLLDE